MSPRRDARLPRAAARRSHRWIQTCVRTVAEGGVAGALAHAEMCLPRLIRLDDVRHESGAGVRSVAKWLARGLAAAAPGILLAFF